MPEPTDPNPVVDALLASGSRELTTTPIEDTAVIDAENPVEPIPAEGAPHAFVAVCRNPAAKHAAWWQDAVVIPAQSTEEQHYYTRQGYELLPIGPDGDTGTRAIVEPRVIAAPTSAEEFTAWRASLDAVPTGSIARTEDLGRIDLWIKAGSKSWEEVRTGHVWTSHELLKRCPVTLIYTPAAVTA